MPSDKVMSLYPRTKRMPEARDTQLIIIEQIAEALARGERKFMLCAPTGSGKSLVGVWAIRMCMIAADEYQRRRKLDPSYTEEEREAMVIKTIKAVYTSPLNALVDQIKATFSPDECMFCKDGIFTLKGREHYPCVADIDSGRNAADGFCQGSRCGETGMKPRDCKNCSQDNRSTCVCMTRCIYKAARTAFESALISNTNMSLFMILGGNRDVVVIDECDAVAEFVRMRCSITIDEYIHFGPMTDQSPHYKSHIDRLKELLGIYSSQILEYEGNSGISLTEKEYKSLKEKKEKLIIILSDYEHYKMYWAVTHDDDRTKTTYQPITVDRFLDDMLTDKYVIMMSATPIKKPGYVFIEVPSTFPVENRPWVYYPLGKMGINHREQTSKNIAKFLNQLRGKTLVHCHSYAIARTLNDDIRRIDPKRAVILQHKGRTGEHSEIHTYGRDLIVSRFKEHPDPNAIMLSVNLSRGIDFPEPEIRNNVIAKVPWFNPSDILTMARNYAEEGVDWQHVEIANTIMQAYGRLPRTPEKQSMCYIVDTDFNDPHARGLMNKWYDRKKDKLFYNWFKEAELEV